jgi:replication factor C subunit 2/4
MEQKTRMATASHVKPALPWVEKYRPTTLADVVGNQQCISMLATFAQKGNLPNVLLCGPPGTGKTTSVMALARQLLGDHFVLGQSVLELNASDER